MRAMSTRMAGLALFALVACAAPSGSPAIVPATRVAPAEPHAGALAPVSSFDAITDRAARSRAVFSEIGKVLVHPRCVNCHTPDGSPRQGDDHELHDPPVARGTGDRGVTGMQCTGCHQDRNLELSRVPGAPGWHLAPLAMVWLDRTPAQICAQLVDRKHNGDRSLSDLQEHFAKDRLVAWGWSPGAGRTPAPGSQAALGELVAAWIDSGAQCPEEVAK
jgi:hypothetical protein